MMQNLTTKLKDRTLRFDGVNIVHADDVPFFLCQGLLPKSLQVLESDTSIEQFNEQVSEDEAIVVYDRNLPITVNMGWLIPQYYLDINLEEYVMDRLADMAEKHNYSDEEIELAAERVALELEQIDERGMEEFMATIIYILDKFKETNQVWGVGRGSSCASYVLYLIGLHCVDCLRYDIPLDEFFHD